MSKRPRSSDHCSDRPAKRPSKGQQQHLYVLLDDWERGYRVGEDDFSTDSDAYPETLGTDSPVARIEARHPFSWSFATHGTNILAVRPSKGSPAMSGFDPQTMGVTLCPLSLNQSSILRPFYASVGDKLFAMVYPLLEVLGSGRRLTARSLGPVLATLPTLAMGCLCWAWASHIPQKAASTNTTVRLTSGLGLELDGFSLLFCFCLLPLVPNLSAILHG
ncbi:hypothetical protein ACQ4PT_059058 [Festuca glaucescens]